MHPRKLWTGRHNIWALPRFSPVSGFERVGVLLAPQTPDSESTSTELAPPRAPRKSIRTVMRIDADYRLLDTGTTLDCIWFASIAQLEKARKDSKRIARPARLRIGTELYPPTPSNTFGLEKDKHWPTKGQGRFKDATMPGQNSGEEGEGRRSKFCPLLCSLGHDTAGRWSLGRVRHLELDVAVVPLLPGLAALLAEPPRLTLPVHQRLPQEHPQHPLPPQNITSSS